MQKEVPFTFTLAGFLHGSLLYGSIISIIHIIHNGLSLLQDSLIVWVTLFFVYGLVGAAFALFFGMVAYLFSRIRGPQAQAPEQGSPKALEAGMLAGVMALNLLFWLFYFNYGLTYDHYPFGELKSVWGMLLFIGIRTVLVVLGVWLGSWVVTKVFLGWLLKRPVKRALGLIVCLFLAHVAMMPLYFSFSAKPNASSGPQAGSIQLNPIGDYKVIFLCLDGADWRVLDPLMAAGRLPTFERLINSGSYGPLETLKQANSAVIWASIYTGKAVEKHQVKDFYRVSLPFMGDSGIFPVHRTGFAELVGGLEALGIASRHTVHRGSLRGAPIWEVVNGTGLSIGVIDGYFYSYPAFRPHDDASFFFSYGLERQYQRLTTAGKPVTQEKLASYVQPLRMLEYAMPHLDQKDFFWQSSLSLDLLRNRPQPRFLLIYTHEPDRVQHWYWKWFEPQYFLGVDEEELRLYGDRIPRLYEAFDRYLAHLLNAIDPNTILVIASDHGHSPTILHTMYTQHRHGPPGIILMAGGPIKQGYTLANAHVLDIYPTILHLLGLPVPEDVDGRVLTEAFGAPFLERSPIRRIPSFDFLSNGPQDISNPSSMSTERNEELLEELRSLGYIK